MSGVIQAERDAVLSVFEQYCAFGDNSGAQSSGMTSRNFAKLAKECRLLSKSLTLTHLDLAYTKASRSPTGSTYAQLDTSWAGGKRINFQQFLLALQYCAEARGCDVSDLHKLIAAKAEEGPESTATEAKFNRFYDDKSTYTVLQRGDSKSRLLERSNSQSQLPAPKLPEDNKPVFQAFEMYALFGETTGGQMLGMTSRNFVKLFKDCELLDRKVTLTFLDLTFTKAARAPGGPTGAPQVEGAKRINYMQFLIAVKICAEQKGTSVDSLYKAIAARAEMGPKTQTATQAMPNRFHDDRSTYTSVARNDAVGEREMLRERSDSLGKVATAGLVAGALARRNSGDGMRRPSADFGSTSSGSRRGSKVVNTFDTGLPPKPEPKALPTPSEPANRAALTDVFEQYCRFGETAGGGAMGLTSRNFIKLCKDSGILDKTLNLTFLDLAYTKAARAPPGPNQAPLGHTTVGKRLTFHQFLVATELMAEAKGCLAGEIHSTMLVKSAEGPRVTATHAPHNKFFDDKSTWTAVARQK